MKKLFLASLFMDVVPLFTAFAQENLAGKRVAFIPTASLVEEMNFYVGNAQEALMKMGVIIDELDVSRASKEEIIAKLTNDDFIYVSGGNTFYLLQELKRSGADSIIIDQINKGKMYVGESAGSIIMSPDIEYAHLMDDRAAAKTLKDCRSLGAVDFYPVPHYTNFPFENAVESIIKEFEEKLDLRLMTNSQAITVRGDVIALVE